jgi:hypothetical protein
LNYEDKVNSLNLLLSKINGAWASEKI